MEHTDAHTGKHPHGFIQLHLANIANAKAAEADVNAVKGVISDIKDVTIFQDSIFVYVDWDQPLHVPQNDNTPAHARVQALRIILEGRTNPRGGAPFYAFGLSHNWCCYGDQ